MCGFTDTYYCEINVNFNHIIVHAIIHQIRHDRDRDTHVHIPSCAKYAYIYMHLFKFHHIINNLQLIYWNPIHQRWRKCAKRNGASVKKGAYTSEISIKCVDNINDHDEQNENAHIFIPYKHHHPNQMYDNFHLV